ncbi:MAG: histidine kinase, partial [Eubacteriales bacterium]|nr:histidine kinase [Eubacteriales bacterium]
KNTYWYIKHYSGEVAESWNLRFLSSGDTSDYRLSYGRTIYDVDEKSIGVIILTSEDESLFRTLKKLASDDNKIYILDRNGIVVSHTNSQMIGNWMANMETFEEKYAPYNSFRIVQRGKNNVMLSNYHDPESGWTFVEEQRVNQLLTNVFHIIAVCLFWVIMGSIFILMISYARTKKISDVFEQFSEDIQNMQADDLAALPVREQCEEAYVLSKAFNGMLERISKLIVDIQRREQEKRKKEYDFLHAQMDPHFLNNTLVAVKSLIAMEDMERASKMMEELIELLHVPAMPEIQFVSLKEELNLVYSFES